MEYPMQVYGLNLFEQFLADVLVALGWLLILFALATGVWFDTFHAHALVAGLLMASTGMTGVLLLLAGAGIRQNRPALDMGCFFLALIGLGWLVSGFVPLNVAPLVAGVLLLGGFGLLLCARRQAVQARFKPRCLSLRKFETMVQVADTMIDGDGDEVLHPIEVAIRVDHLLARIDSPIRRDIETVLVLVEWLLPLLVWRPIPFSDLGSHARRRAVEKVIGAKGLFRDVARSLKTLAAAGYYGSPAGMAQVGYRPFEARRRAQGVDQTPHHYPDPFADGGAS
jgi:hypothetical protein